MAFASGIAALGSRLTLPNPCLSSPAKQKLFPRPGHRRDGESCLLHAPVLRTSAHTHVQSVGVSIHSRVGSAGQLAELGGCTALLPSSFQLDAGAVQAAAGLRRRIVAAVTSCGLSKHGGQLCRSTVRCRQAAISGTL